MEFENKIGALDDEDLVIGEKESKNWKGIVISFMVIGSILSAIIVAIILCTPNGDVENNRLKLDFDAIIGDQYRARRFNGSWLSDHELVYVDQSGNIVIHDAELNRTSSVLVRNQENTLHKMTEFSLSSDRKFILFVSEHKRQTEAGNGAGSDLGGSGGSQNSGGSGFLGPELARYAIYNITSQTVEYLDELLARASFQLSQGPHLQWASLSPGNQSILFIESNDLYYVTDLGAASPRLIRLTRTGGLSDLISNGLPDSLYRMHIFADQPATVWPSSDGRHLAYLSFDDALVETTPIELYESYLGDSSSQPRVASQRYPRAGQMNPKVSVHVVDLASSLANEADLDGAILAPPPELIKQQQQNSRLVPYVTYVGWYSPATSSVANNPSERTGESNTVNQLLIMWMNRAQNQTLLTSCQPLPGRSRAGPSSAISSSNTPIRPTWISAGWRCELLTTLTNRLSLAKDASKTILITSNWTTSGQKGSQLESGANEIGLSSERLVFLAIPRPDSILGDHIHVALLRPEDRAPKYLSHGEFDVDQLLAYEPSTDSLYFEGRDSRSAERHLYRLTKVGVAGLRQTHCLTCTLVEPCGHSVSHLPPAASAFEGTGLGGAKSHFRFVVHECLGPSVPNVWLRRLGSEWIQGGNSNGATTGNNNISQIHEMTNLFQLENNERLEQIVRTKQVPFERFFVIQRNQRLGSDVFIKLYLPVEIEEEKDKKFPLLIESSDIEERKVSRQFELDWGRYLASRKQVVYAKIDCVRSTSSSRSSSSSSSTSSPSPSVAAIGVPATTSTTGSGVVSSSAGSRTSPATWPPSATYQLASSSQVPLGAEFANEQVHLRDSPLFNAADQLEVIKFIVEHTDLFPWLDRRRIAIWGPTSGSAYVALSSTGSDESRLIQCTIAIAPITHWNYMSSYLAEHYLGVPWADQSSRLNYDTSSLLKRSQEFANRKLLLVHGTADTQVHVQHSMQLLKFLTQTHQQHSSQQLMAAGGGILHQMQLYPDVGHSLEPVRRHLFMTLDGFVDRCFYQKPIAIKATEWKGKVRPKLY